MSAGTRTVTAMLASNQEHGGDDAAARDTSISPVAQSFRGLRQLRSGSKSPQRTDSAVMLGEGGNSSPGLPPRQGSGGVQPSYPRLTSVLRSSLRLTGSPTGGSPIEPNRQASPLAVRSDGGGGGSGDGSLHCIDEFVVWRIFSSYTEKDDVRCSDCGAALTLHMELRPTARKAPEDRDAQAQETLTQAYYERAAWRRTLWYLMEQDEKEPAASSKRFQFAARALASLSLLLILVSVIVFIIETHPDYYEDSPTVFFIIESVCMGYFTIEVLARAISCPQFKRWLFSFFTLVDIVSIIPYYLDLMVGRDQAKGLLIVRTLRLVRVFRTYKVAKSRDEITIVARCLRNSTEGLYLLLFLVAMSVVVFSSVMYFVEREGYSFDEAGNFWFINTTDPWSPFESRHTITRAPFQSIVHTFWWCIVTLTTVGYGDEVPVSAAGKAIACITMLCGTLVMAFPMVIISQNFHDAYQQYNRQKQLRQATETANGKNLVERRRSVVSMPSANIVGRRASMVANDDARGLRASDTSGASQCGSGPRPAGVFTVSPPDGHNQGNPPGGAPPPPPQQQQQQPPQPQDSTNSPLLHPLKSASSLNASAHRLHSGMQRAPSSMRLGQPTLLNKVSALKQTKATLRGAGGGGAGGAGARGEELVRLPIPMEMSRSGFTVQTSATGGSMALTNDTAADRLGSMQPVSRDDSISSARSPSRVRSARLHDDQLSLSSQASLSHRHSIGSAAGSPTSFPSHPAHASDSSARFKIYRPRSARARGDALTNSPMNSSGFYPVVVHDGEGGGAPNRAGSVCVGTPPGSPHRVVPTVTVDVGDDPQRSGVFSRRQSPTAVARAGGPGVSPRSGGRAAALQQLELEEKFSKCSSYIDVLEAKLGALLRKRRGSTVDSGAASAAPGSRRGSASTAASERGSGGPTKQRVRSRRGSVESGREMPAAGITTTRGKDTEPINQPSPADGALTVPAMLPPARRRRRSSLVSNPGSVQDPTEHAPLSVGRHTPTPPLSPQYSRSDDGSIDNLSRRRMPTMPTLPRHSLEGDGEE